MDFSGSVFSIISLVFGEEIDSLDLANYIAIACLDTGILALYYLFEWYQKKIILKETLEESQIDQASSPEDVTETMSNDSQEEKKTPSQ